MPTCAWEDGVTMAEACDLVLTGGRVVTPGGIVEGGVAVRGGRIVAIGGAGTAPASRTIDLRGRVLLPGVIDPECHLGGHRLAGGRHGVGDPRARRPRV